MKRFNRNSISSIIINNKQKEIFWDKCVKYIPLFLGCFLLMSLLFNVGYFMTTSLQYVNFLTYGDYFEGTMPFIVIYVLLAFFMLTQPISWFPSIMKDFELYMKNVTQDKFLHKIIYLQIHFESFIGAEIQECISNCVIKDKYYFNPIKQYEDNLKLKKELIKKDLPKDIFLKRKLVKIRKVMRPILKYLSISIKIAISFLIMTAVVLFCIIAIFGWLYFYFYLVDYIGETVQSVYIGCFNFICLLLCIYTLVQLIIRYSDKCQYYHFIMVILCFYAPILGEAKFVYDWTNTSLVVFDNMNNNDEKYLIRALSKGYFVKSKNTLTYIQNDKINKIQQQISNIK